jgi:hypothetical protein
MRIKYTGTAEAGVPRFPGLWQPGEEQDVSDEDGKYLLGSSLFVAVSAASVAPIPTPTPPPVEDPALPPEAPASDIA